MQWCRLVGRFIFVCGAQKSENNFIIPQPAVEPLPPFRARPHLSSFDRLHLLWMCLPSIMIHGALFTASRRYNIPKKAQNNKKQQQTKSKNMCGTLAIL